MQVPFVSPSASQAPAEPVLRCRYRYATGCDWQTTVAANSRATLNAHEKQTTAHALHRIELLNCPACGTRFKGEMPRAVHLSNEHGIRAGSPERMEADARQVKELYDAKFGSAPVPEPSPNGSHPAASSANGHAPERAADITAARSVFAALLDEVEALRAENAGLRADAETFRQIRSMFAGQS
jgi:hypothetical protein